MALTYFGHLGFGEAETPFLSPTVQASFYATTQDLLDRYRADTAAVENILVERTTENFQEYYRLTSFGGRMQMSGGHDRPKGRKGITRYTVGYPIEQWFEGIMDERIGLAYLTVEQYDEHVTSIFKAHSATVRHEMMRRLFKGTSDTYQDPIWGQTTVMPLANGDSQTYPLGVSGADPVTANQMIATNFAAASITNTNNPYALIAAKWNALFPSEALGGNALVFIHSDQLALTQALASFTARTDAALIQPVTATRLTDPPAVPKSAYVVGRSNGMWIAVWDAAVDTGYMISVHPGVRKPLVKRVDTRASGIPQGLHLESEKGYDSNWPFREQVFMDRFGYGVGNRLGAVVLQLVASTTFTPPVRYSI